MKLSLCIPTYNEEKNIHIALDSAYDMADEVVIIDGGSTDKTIQIAKSYGPKVKIYEVDNPPNFLLNKERAIEKAKNEWILQLDADEAVTPELKKEINSILDNPNPEINGYWIPRKNYFLGRFLMKGGVYPDSVLRLYKGRCSF
jgi:glycosyltransferase involved in cell wall biosynthesis